MKYLSRSTLGVIIGCFIVCGFSTTIIYIIFVLSDFYRLTDEDKKGNEDVWSTTVTVLYIVLAICIIATILSGLLVAGIFKKRHTLMRPWVYCSMAGIICYTFRLIVGFFTASLSGAPLSAMFSIIFSGLLILAIQILIFCPIYKLYKDISHKSSELEREETRLNPNNDSPPSYSELERNGQI